MAALLSGVRVAEQVIHVELALVGACVACCEVAAYRLFALGSGALEGEGQREAPKHGGDHPSGVPVSLQTAGGAALIVGDVALPNNVDDVQFNPGGGVSVCGHGFFLCMVAGGGGLLPVTPHVVPPKVRLGGMAGGGGFALVAPVSLLSDLLGLRDSEMRHLAKRASRLSSRLLFLIPCNGFCGAMVASCLKEATSGGAASSPAFHADLARVGRMCGPDAFRVIGAPARWCRGAGRSPRAALNSDTVPFVALSSSRGLHRTGARRRERVARPQPSLLRGPVGGVTRQQVRAVGGAA